MTTPRREFLQWAAMLGATPAFLAAAAPARPSKPSGPGDWDMSWTRRLTGRHRAVLDAPTPSEGDPILRAVVWARQHAEVFGATPRQLDRVLVLRHTGIDLAMNDAHWARFGIGREHGFLTPDGNPLPVNPVRAERPEVPQPFRSMTLEAFQRSGGIVLACHLALQAYVAPRYQTAGASPSEALEAATAELLPGIILQPSGIFAVSVAQEHGCRYVPVS
jgi:hypothetical protein